MHPLRLLPLVLLAAACSQPASDLPVWSARDHDQEEPAPAAARPSAPASPEQAASKTDDPADLAAVVWTTRCAECHGMGGVGDGPKGPMVKAPDLTRADWQRKASDAQIAQNITRGRGKMPKFDLSPAVVSALVKHVRALRADGKGR